MIYDFIIVGGGPAGLSAAIYSTRFKLKTLVLAREPGGLLTNTHLVENWPGAKSTSGADLMAGMQEHAESLGAEVKQAEVTAIKKKGGLFSLATYDGELQAKAILLATGTSHRKLGVLGEAEFHGKGVSYCAVCDAAFFKGKTVAIIGGSDSAAKEALLLSEYAGKVYLVYRGEKIRAEPANAERVEKNKKVEVITNTNVTAIKGGKFVESVSLDKSYKGSKELKLDGVFIDIGYDPQSELAKQLGVKLSEKGEIITDYGAKTNVTGVFAAGDVVSGSFKQAITAAAQGAIAAKSAYNFINVK